MDISLINLKRAIFVKEFIGKWIYRIYSQNILNALLWMWLILGFSVLERSIHCYKLNVLVSFIYSFVLFLLLCFNWNCHVLLLVSLCFYACFESLIYIPLIRTEVKSKESREDVVQVTKFWAIFYQRVFFLHVTFSAFNVLHVLLISCRCFKGLTPQTFSNFSNFWKTAFRLIWI